MQTTITFKSGGRDLDAELFKPAGTPNGGVIVIGYGSDGMHEPWGAMIRGYAEAFAEKGFVALIPDYLSSTRTRPGPGVLPLILDRRDDWQGAVADAIGYAQSLSKVDATRVGLLGFSLGGHLCLRLRGRGKILASFFAPLLHDGIGAPGTVTHAQVHHGEADSLPGTDFSNAVSIAATLKAEGVATRLYKYARPDTASSPHSEARTRATRTHARSRKSA